MRRDRLCLLLALGVGICTGAALTLAIQAWQAGPPPAVHLETAPIHPPAATALPTPPALPSSAPASTPNIVPTIHPTAAVSAPTQSPATTFSETFDGAPAQPAAWRSPHWDVAVHSRDMATWAALEPMQAQHGADCGAPPATHLVASYEQAVFHCRDHLMTAINAQGYGAIYLTPDHMVDFSSGEAVVRFELSTLRRSGRDWIDLWISPYEDQLQLPLEHWLPDLTGEPRNALHVRMDSFNGQTIFKATLIRDFVPTELQLASTEGYEQRLTPDARRRDTFELRIAADRLRFGMPAHQLTWVDTALPELGWSQGVVQFGHHSYNPSKDCAGCTANTWHWDAISIAPARPFTIIAADRRSVSALDAAPIGFAQPAPPAAHLRFAGIGVSLEVSFDGGASWQPAQRQAQLGEAEDHFASYWMPIPPGTQRVQLRGQPWWGGPWHVRDLAIWAAP